MATQAVPQQQTKTRRRPSFRLGRLVPHVLLWAFLFLVFVPLIWMIATSFKDKTEFATNPAGLIPRTWSLVNYQYLWSALELLPVYIGNSFIISFGTAALQVVLASLAGYGFARIRFRGSNIIFLMLMVSMFIPRSGGLMALYELMAALKLRNSLLGIILLFAANVPVAIFIMRQSFLALPQEIEEAALIDGASWFQVFWRIALPLATGGMLIVAVLAFVTVWGDYLVTYTLIDQDGQMPISVGIQKILVKSYETALSPQFRGQFAGEAANAAALLFATVPVVVLYAVLQRWFMRGLMEGALKG